MDLKSLAKKPKLVQVSLEDKETVEEFGEPVVFYTWDRTPINDFMKLASIDKDNYSSVVDAMSSLILDKDGKPVMEQGVSLPNHVLMKSITAVVSGLGKSQK
tara:strand:- start:13287 stop:13592 length:306 start_codon:yes stop_codon:yes gene_type:complete